MRRTTFLLIGALAACTLACKQITPDNPAVDNPADEQKDTDGKKDSDDEKPGDEPENLMGGSEWLALARDLTQTEAVDTYKAPEAPFTYQFTYEYLPGNFCNPERGAYHPRELHFRKDTPPKPHTVDNLKASRESGCTLNYLGLYFMDYFYEDLPQSVLDIIREEFENVRKAGTKLVLRHAYSWNSNVGEQEPPVGWILRHIKQLKPLLQEYYDIIYVVQAGFIGTYGEWAFRSNVSGDVQDRMVVDALLDALPASRQVAIRTPRHTMDMYNLHLKDTLTRKTAFDGSAHSRLAAHNDCFLTNGNDCGTYAGSVERKFWLKDSRFMSMGGENCIADDPKLCGCVNAYQDLKDYHWSYLSAGKLTDHWKNGGCNDDIVSRVGYRFVLNGLATEGNFAAGKDFTLKICLTNFGFASLINPRQLHFVIRNSDDPSELYDFVSETDPRVWEGCNSYVHKETLHMPEGLKSGAKYTVYLNLPDESKHLANDPRYSVRFANKDVWDEATGYNRLAEFTAE